ncbi:MAG TPA: hypothetical protein VF366_04680 [Dehalococcoidia bacterium]
MVTTYSLSRYNPGTVSNCHFLPVPYRCLHSNHTRQHRREPNCNGVDGTPDTALEERKDPQDPVLSPVLGNKHSVF